MAEAGDRDPQRWERIEDLFTRALDLPESERVELVEAECASDPSVRAEVLALLASAGRAGASIQGIVAAGARGAIGAREVASGTLLGQRFEIERRVGAGGMGTVYRAIDRVDGTPVAVKVLAAVDHARFDREARVLAGLQHARIVRYIANGTDGRYGPYLAMEWLEGEDLATRIARAPLTVGQSLDLAKRIARALEYAHARGIVHRDIKPSNLWLVGGEPSGVKLLDFGIARARGATTLTASNAIVGTVGYMAPEQARGQRTIGPAADLFALGCVLYECIAGSPAFDGDHPVATLVKVLHDEPPALRTLRPELPALVDQLVTRLLDKDPSRRSSDAAAVALAIEALGAVDLPAPAAGEPLVPGTAPELRLLQLLLVDPRAADELEPSVTAIERATASFGVLVTPLPSGLVLLSMPDRGSARDRAEAAGNAARVIVETIAGARVAVVSGRGAAGRVPVSVIDRCASILDAVPPGRIAVDETTARLVEERFVVQAGTPALLAHDRAHLGHERLLLGKPMPCVGRTKELALFEAMIDEAVEESSARSLLVTAIAGAGKSRLAFELLRRLASRPALAVFSVRGDPVEASSNLAMLKSLVLGAAGIDADASTGACERALHAILDGAAQDPDRATDFLVGDALGRVLPGSRTPEFRAARHNPSERYAWLERSVLELLDARSRRGPLLVVVDDCHWAGAATIHYLGEALRRLHDRPLFVLALARPEVDALFGKPWPALQRLALDPLTRRAAADLARAALGAEVSASVIGSLIERAQGNAFYLEELVRVAAAGGRDLPETVQAMVEVRLQAEDADARHLLRSASVFGDRCPLAAIAALSGESEASVHALLEQLARSELVDRHRDERESFVFRHAIVREVAYATIPDAERIELHRRAASWLEGRGETDPVVLAGHHEQAGNRDAAAEYITRAVEQAFTLGQIPRTLELADRALATHTLTARQRCRVQVDHCGALIQIGALAEHEAANREVLGLAAPGSVEWIRALSTHALLLYFTDRVPEARQRTTELASERIAGVGSSGIALWNIGMAFLLLGQRAHLRDASGDAHALADASVDPAFAGYARGVGSFSAVFAMGDLGRALRDAHQADELLPHIASPNASGMCAWWQAWVFWCAGDDQRALAIAQQLRRDPSWRAWPLLQLLTVTTLGCFGHLDPDPSAMAYTAPLRHGFRYFLASGEASARLAAGDRAEADRLAGLALEGDGGSGWTAANAITILARSALERGDLDRARALADRAVEQALGGCCALRHTAEAWACLVDVHLARGDREAADRVRGDARARLLAVASGMDPGARDVFARASPYDRLLQS